MKESILGLDMFPARFFETEKIAQQHKKFLFLSHSSLENEFNKINHLHKHKITTITDKMDEYYYYEIGLYGLLTKQHIRYLFGRYGSNSSYGAYIVNSSCFHMAAKTLIIQGWLNLMIMDQI